MRDIIHQDVSSCCKLCAAEEEETIMHLFFDCRFVAPLWKKICEWLELDMDIEDNVRDNLVAFANWLRQNPESDG